MKRTGKGSDKAPGGKTVIAAVRSMSDNVEEVSNMLTAIKNNESKISDFRTGILKLLNQNEAFWDKCGKSGTLLNGLVADALNPGITRHSAVALLVLLHCFLTEFNGILASAVDTAKNQAPDGKFNKLEAVPALAEKIMSSNVLLGSILKKINDLAKANPSTNFKLKDADLTWIPRSCSGLEHPMVLGLLEVSGCCLSDEDKSSLVDTYFKEKYKNSAWSKTQDTKLRTAFKSWLYDHKYSDDDLGKGPPTSEDLRSFWGGYLENSAGKIKDLAKSNPYTDQAFASCEPAKFLSDFVVGNSKTGAPDGLACKHPAAALRLALQRLLVSSSSAQWQDTYVQHLPEALKNNQDVSSCLAGLPDQVFSSIKGPTSSPRGNLLGFLDECGEMIGGFGTAMSEQADTVSTALADNIKKPYENIDELCSRLIFLPKEVADGVDFLLKDGSALLAEPAKFKKNKNFAALAGYKASLEHVVALLDSLNKADAGGAPEPDYYSSDGT